MVMWRLLLTLILPPAMALPILHAEPTLKPPPDWVVTLQARRTLWADPALADLNLGVRVRAGEALVWGPVLNEDQAAEAVARVKLVPGVSLVINELFVLPADDLLRRKFRKPGQPVSVVTPGVRAVP